MKRFEDLYKYLQDGKCNLLEWLKDSWKGKDKQESLFRLFGTLGLIQQFNSYSITEGNYDIGSLKKTTNISTFLKKCMKDSNEVSDFSVMDENTLIIGSSKKTCHGIGNMDIEKLKSHTDKYPTLSIKFWFLVRDKKDFLGKVDRSQFNKKDLKKIVLDSKEEGLVFDWNDLAYMYKQFLKIYKTIDIKDITIKHPLIPKFHQEYSALRSVELLENYDSILLGHIPRSGKSYIESYIIYLMSQNIEKYNVIHITTYPESLKDYENIFTGYSQFSDFNIIRLCRDNGSPKLKDKNVILCSKQFLDDKVNTKRIKWLEKIQFNISFFDEIHNGGTTTLSKNILNNYCKGSKHVYITATYIKPINNYNISEEQSILWDIEDIHNCKKINHSENRQLLIEKHIGIGKILENYLEDEIIKEYSKYPELHIITQNFKENIKKDILNGTKGSSYGYSCESVLLLKNNKSKTICKFQDEEAVKKFSYSIFGKTNKYGVPDKEYKDYLLCRIEKICKNPEFNSRWFSKEKPLTILCFLPYGPGMTIKNVSQAYKNILENNNIIPDMKVIMINSSINKKRAKDIIDDAQIQAKHEGKKGVVVLSGKQCSMSVTLELCDIVILMNNSSSFDFLYQCMFRCMSEAPGKKCGFVIDMNIQRAINMVIDYSLKVKPGLSTKKALKYVLQQRLITLNGDQWMKDYFCTGELDINKISAFYYKIWSSNSSNSIDSVLKTFLNVKLTLYNNEQKLFNALFNTVNNQSIQKETLKDRVESKDKDIKKGMERIKDDTEEIGRDEESKEDNTKNVDLVKNVLSYLIPLVCLLTINRTQLVTFDSILLYINSNIKLKNIFLGQIKMWWTKKLPENIIDLFLKIHSEHLSTNKEFSSIVRRIKELLSHTINNTQELSILIDKYLVPHDSERKQNAEISTPITLRKEMLDKVPYYVWEESYIVKNNGDWELKLPKVFEPCCGKGGFVIDIVGRLMKGLKSHIPDDKERYKVILEECLYFADINPTNIFITCLLLDPYEKYKLNYYEGDTLKLDIMDKWKINGFTAVIGNPPYNSSGSTATGNTIWQHFTRKSLAYWLDYNGVLCFVHPPGWRKPNTTKGKFYGMYDLMAKDSQILFLSIHGIKDGKQIFNAGTRYDWYVIEKKIKYMNTMGKDENGCDFDIDMSDFNWLPNSNIDTIQKLLANKNEEKCKILQSMSAYEPRKKWISKKESKEFKYPVVHSTPKSGTRYVWSNRNDNGFYGIKKVIFGDGGINKPIIDITGKYGMTQHAMAIVIDDIKDGEKISKVLCSSIFKKIIKSCSWSSFAIEWGMFKDFKKNFCELLDDNNYKI